MSLFLTLGCSDKGEERGESDDDDWPGADTDDGGSGSSDGTDDGGDDGGEETGGGDTASQGDSGTANAPPSAPVVVISPSEPTAIDELACVIETESTDPEGDAITYAYTWTVDGEDAGIEESGVSASVTAPREQWACTVTPSDGTMDGEAATATVSISEACTALQFDGEDDGARVGDSSGLGGIGAELTVELWVFLTDYPTHSAPLVRKWETNQYDWTLQIRSDGVLTGAVFGASGSCNVEVTLATDRWYHVALVLDAPSSLSLHLDGTSWDSTSCAVSQDQDGGAPVVIGAGTDGTHLPAIIDEVRISDVARAIVPMTWYETDADTLALWHIDEGSGLLLEDATENGYDATIADGTWTTSSACDAK